MQTRRRLLLFRFVLGLVFGFVCTVGVAWGFAVLYNFGWSSNLPWMDQGFAWSRTYGVYPFSSTQFWDLELQSTYGAELLIYEGGWVEGGVVRPSSGRYFNDASIPSWCRAVNGAEWDWDNELERSRVGEPAVEDVRGWPYFCLSHTLRFLRTSATGGGTRTTKLEWGIRIRETDWSGLDGPAVWEGSSDALPLRPIWSGLVLNTLFYAVPYWLLLFALPFTRRTWRAWHGRCVECGYDLRGSTGPVCPECGCGAVAIDD